jgi:hypothetical protein
MFRQLNHSVVVRDVAVFVAFVVVSSCTLATDVNKPGAIIRYTGEGQSAPINTPLPSPLQLLVVNQFGQILKNVNVNWSIVSGGGTLSATTTLSNESGIAEVNYTTGPTAGTAIINAQVHGILPLSFTATITP